MYYILKLDSCRPKFCSRARPSILQDKSGSSVSVRRRKKERKKEKKKEGKNKDKQRCSRSTNYCPPPPSGKDGARGAGRRVPISGRGRDGLLLGGGGLAGAGVRGAEALEQVLLDGDDAAAGGLAAVEGAELGLGVAVEEEGDRVAVGAARVDDAVQGALVDALGPQREHVADVDDVGVRVRGDGVPGARRLVEDLEAAGGVLEEEGDGAFLCLVLVRQWGGDIGGGYWRGGG